jgi:hypothetical protein
MFKLGSSGVYQAADSFKNITAGTYTVYVKDSTGCVISADITITSAAGSITATSTPTSACGYSGYIYITASGTGPFMYKLNNGIYQVSGTFSNLAAGTYIAYAKDGSGCERVTNVTVGTSGGSCPSY